MQFKLGLIPAATALMLVACGGGSSTSPTPTPTPSMGVAVDGYIQFAKVVCDLNDNGTVETNETVVYTRADGNFTFPNGCTHGIIVSGGLNLDVTNADNTVTPGTPFVGVLRAPAGATVASPLTTLIAAGMTAAQVKTALGLPAGTNLLTDDPMLNNPELLKKTVMVQNLLQKITETFAKPSGASGSVVLSAIYTEAATAFADVLKNGVTPIGTDGKADESVINALTKAAGDKVLSSVLIATVAPEVKAGMNKVGTTVMAAALDKALKADADKVLAETDAVKIASVTLTIQANEGVANFINQQITAGALKPGSTAAEVDAVAANVVVAIATPTPTPTPTGTLLASFDEATQPTITEFGGAGYDFVVATPAGGTGKSLKITRPAGAGALNYAGAFVTTAPIPFSATRKTISAWVYSPAAGTPMVAKAEFAEQQGTGDTLASTAVVAGWQKLTWVFNNVDLGKSYTRFVILPNLGTVGTGQTYFIDDIVLEPASAIPSLTEPTTAAATPIALAANVLSIYSDAYTPVAGVNLRPDWGQTTAVTEVMVADNKTQKYTAFNYEGITFTPINMSSMTKLHIDVWTPDLTALDVYVLAGGAEQSVKLTPTKAGWNSFDINLSDYTTLNKAAVKELKLVSTGGSTLYFDNLYFWKPAEVAPLPTNYLYLTDNALTLFNGSTDTSYSMTQFQSAAGISVKWPMADSASLKLKLAENGSFVMGNGQTFTAAMQITETVAGGLGEIKGYIDNVSVTKTGGNVTVTVPGIADALLYGVSHDGKMKAIINFAGAVANVTNTLTSASNAVNNIILGNVVNYAVNGVSNDFTGMNALRGKYQVKIVVTELPLRKTDGTKFEAMTIEVPTKVVNGVPGTIKPVTGFGIQGYITLTN